MAENEGGVRVYNPDKQISEQITLKNLVMHNSAMNLARTGVPELPSDKPLSLNQRILNRFRGLNQIISTQQSILTNALPIVKFNCRNTWEKQNKEDDGKKEHPFEEEDNDYNELMAVLHYLDEYEQAIITARQTKKKDDDFVWDKIDSNGENVLKLSPNFFKMVKNLIKSFEVIYCILLSNKIVSSGISEDEDVKEKEKEEEAMRRITEA